MTANKKHFYNRVRRTCQKYDIEICLEGAPKNYRAAELVKDGQLLMGDYANSRQPLNIDWERFHNELTKYGFVGGVK